MHCAGDERILGLGKFDNELQHITNSSDALLRAFVPFLHSMQHYAKSASLTFTDKMSILNKF